MCELLSGQATSHYLNQCWLVYWRIYSSLGLNELRTFLRNKFNTYHLLPWLPDGLSQHLQESVHVGVIVELSIAPITTRLLIYWHAILPLLQLTIIWNRINSLTTGRCGNKFKKCNFLIHVADWMLDWALLMKLLSGACHRTPLMISQFWFR